MFEFELMIGLDMTLIHGYCMLSRVRLFIVPWTIALQPPLSIGFSRQEYWSGLPFPARGDCSNPGIKPESLVSPVLPVEFYTTMPPSKTILLPINSYKSLSLYT